LQPRGSGLAAALPPRCLNLFERIFQERQNVGMKAWMATLAARMHERYWNQSIFEPAAGRAFPAKEVRR
jgi:hypothetical protein